MIEKANLVNNYMEGEKHEKKKTNHLPKFTIYLSFYDFFWNLQTNR